MANLAQIIPALFVGPGGQQLTEAQIRERQMMAQDLLAQATDTSPNAGGVASILAKGLAGFRSGMDRNAADRAISANNQANQGLLQGLLGGLGSTGGVGQSSTVAAPTVAPVQNVAPATNWDASSVPDSLKSGIQETATALGVDPIDLATAISYETAGTFDPTKTGPTTQWGQHRGLIQFGEPQAQKYGVDWNNPIGSQLGANGAVANYLRDTGVQPGMGLLDIYSAINAGGVGRYNRSDANNGGAPGTVRDKVEQQMADHRAKALALFGGQPPAPTDNGIEAALASSNRSAFPPAPSAQSTSSGVNPAIIAALSSPVASEQTRSVASLLLNNQLSQQKAAQELTLKQQQQRQAIAQRQSIAQSMGINPSAALDENAWKAAVEAANRGRQTATVNGVVLDVNTGQPIFQAPQQPTTGIQDYNFYAESERQAGRQPLGPLEYEQALRSAGASRTNIDTGTVPQGYQAIRDEQGRLIRYDPVPGGPADTTKTQEKAQANTQRSSNIVLEDVDRAVSAIESNPALTTGIIGNWSRGIGGTPANKVQNLLQTVRANSAFDRLQQMREASPTGGALGAVSDSELGLLQNAIGSLEQSNNSEDLVYNLRRVQRIYEDIINGPEAAKKMREERSKASESASQPAQGWKDLGNGIKIRPKGSN